MEGNSMFRYKTHLVPGQDSCAGPVEIVHGGQRYKYAFERNWYAKISRHPTGTEVEPELDLNIPSYGVIFMSPPEDAKLDAELRGGEAEWDHVLTGTFEIVLPGGVESVAYKSIKIGVESIARLHMGLGRGIEEDDILRRELMFEDDSIEKTIHGSLNIAFSFILPSWLPLEDFHKESKLQCTLYATIEGISQGPNSSDIQSDASSNGLSARFSRLFWTKDRPEAQEIGHGSSYLERNEVLKVLSSSNSEQPIQGTGTDSRELVGLHTAERPVKVVHNPESSGGINVLDEHITGSAPGLGNYDIVLSSGIWTISSFLDSKVALTDIDPRVTIYHYQVYIRQFHTITSPRDGKIVKADYFVPIVVDGELSARQTKVPGTKFPALWRGKDVSGDGSDVWMSEGKGRLPTDLYLRPSTPSCVRTPIQVRHLLGFDLYFSVQGEDANGKKMKKSGPGEMRILRVTKPVIMPSCWLMPDVLELPKYRPKDDICRHPYNDPRDLYHACACNLTDAEVETRIQYQVRLHGPGADEIGHREMSRRKAEAEGRDWSWNVEVAAGDENGESF